MVLFYKSVSNRFQLNVICCLSKMRLEVLNGTWWQENSRDVWEEPEVLGKEWLSNWKKLQNKLFSVPTIMDISL